MKLNKVYIFSSLVAIISLTIYYFLVTNILRNNTFNFISINVVNDKKSVLITDKEKIDRILSIVNSHTFTRSAVRSVRQQDFSDSQYVMIGAQNEHPSRLVNVYVLKDNIKNNAIEINDQMYNVRNKARLSADILNALKEFGLLSN